MQLKYAVLDTQASSAASPSSVALTCRCKKHKCHKNGNCRRCRQQCQLGQHPRSACLRSSVGNGTPITLDQQRAAQHHRLQLLEKQPVNLPFKSAMFSSSPSSPVATKEAEQPAAVPVPTAASRKRWCMSTPFSSKKAAALEVNTHDTKPVMATTATATAATSSARKNWCRPPLGRFTSVGHSQLVPQGVLSTQQQQRSILDTSITGGRTIWRRYSMNKSCAPCHQQNSLHSFEAEETGYTYSATDNDDEQESCASPVPNAVRDRDAASFL
eukprot:8164-Heterococcus_DN1.PRE.14